MVHQFKEGFKNVLAGRFFPLIAGLLAVVLASGALRSGFFHDDYVHQRKLQQNALLSGDENILTHLFNFRDGSLEQNGRLIKTGRVPWWAAKEMKAAFFRPITAITHWLDYQWWPQKPFMMHLHSLFWFGVMVIAAAIVYRRMMTPLWVAGLAGLLFAIDDAHGFPAGWIANRNALIAATFGFVSLYCHDRLRREQWRPGALLGPLFLAISLLSAEIGLGTGAYLFSYEVFLGTGAWRKRAVRLMPYLLVTAVWWISYKAMGYGTFASGAYIDPGRNPFSYLVHLLERIPVLLYGQWFLLDSLIYGFIPKPAVYGVFALICVLLTGLVVLFIPLLKRNAVARFFALGMVLSLLPVCATFPSNRLLLFAGFGAMGMLAAFLFDWFEGANRFPTNRSWRIPARVSVGVLILIHFIAAPLLLVRESRECARVKSVILDKPLAQISRNFNIDGKTLVFINPPSAIYNAFNQQISKELGLQMPRISYALSSGQASPMTVRRVNETSLEIAPDAGFISIDFDRLYRGELHPMHVGDRVETADMTAEVLSLTEDQRPQRVCFTFSRPLEDTSLAFFAWENKGYHYVPFSLPGIGESVQLEMALIPLT